MIGLGYVDLPTAVVFASRSYSVIGVDVDVRKVKAVNNGRYHLREPGLDDLLRDAVSGFSKATTDAVEAIRESLMMRLSLFPLLLEMVLMICLISGRLLRVLGRDCIRVCWLW